MEDHDSFLVFSGRFAAFERVRAVLGALLILHWFALEGLLLLLVDGLGIGIKADVQVLQILEYHIFQCLLLLIILRGSRCHPGRLISIFDGRCRCDLLLRENTGLGDVCGQ